MESHDVASMFCEALVLGYWCVEDSSGCEWDVFATDGVD
jgi:hypothetical protein